MTDANEEQAQAIALSALVWTLSEQERGERLLSLTGLDPAHLRATAGEAATLAAVLDFLCANEADMIACAGSIEVKPEALARARATLAGEEFAR